MSRKAERAPRPVGRRAGNAQVVPSTHACMDRKASETALRRHWVSHGRVPNEWHYSYQVARGRANYGRTGNSETCTAQPCGRMKQGRAN